MLCFGCLRVCGLWWRKKLQNQKSLLLLLLLVVLVVLLVVGFVAAVEVLWFGEKSLKGGWGRRKRGCQTHVCEDVAAASTSRWPYPRPTSTSPRKSPEVLSVCLSLCLWRDSQTTADLIAHHCRRRKRGLTRCWWWVMGARGWECGIWSSIGRETCSCQEAQAIHIRRPRPIPWRVANSKVSQELCPFLFFLFFLFFFNAARDECSTTSEAALLFLPLLLLIPKGMCTGDLSPWLDASVSPLCVRIWELHCTLACSNLADWWSLRLFFFWNVLLLLSCSCFCFWFCLWLWLCFWFWFWLFLPHWIYILRCGTCTHQQQSGASECGNFGGCTSISSWLLLLLSSVWEWQLGWCTSWGGLETNSATDSHHCYTARLQHL